MISLIFILTEDFMRALTREEAADWCRERGIMFDVHGKLGYGSEAFRRLEVKLPITTAGLIYVARLLVRLEMHGFHASPQKSEDEFAGCLIWVTDYRTWSTVSSEIGLYAFARLGLHGTEMTEPADINRMPVRLFGPGEVVAATTTVLQPLLFQWDVYVVSASGNYIASVSNEGIIQSIIARTSELLDTIKPMFQDLGFREHNSWTPVPSAKL